MVENKDLTHNEPIKKENSLKSFLLDTVRGAGMGIAFIIPGFSGGSVAAILGIYERLVGAIANIFKSFKKSFKALLPIFIGMVLGVIALLFPLKWALSFAPLPTVSLFVGLAIGGLPTITDKLRGKLSYKNIIAFLIPALLTFLLSFAPTGAEVDLYSLNFGGYLLLFGIGLIASAALVIPGISGSMIMLVLGYYNPLVTMITDFIKIPVKAILGEGFNSDGFFGAFLVLISCGLGIIVGFIAISAIMSRLLSKYQRGTYFSIFGFIIGSLPPVFTSAAKDAGYTLDTLPTSPLHWIACVILLALGVVGAFLFVRFAKKKLGTHD